MINSIANLNTFGLLTKSVLLCFSCFFCMSFFVPEKVSKKADAVIAKFYKTNDFSRETIDISDNFNTETAVDFSEENLFKIISDGKHLGYGYIGNAPSKTATFDYLVLFDTNFIITKSKVLIYREEYGGEIGSKRWLRQFTGASMEKQFTYNQDIIPISGATISVQSMTRSMNSLLESIKFLKKNKQL